MLMLARRVESRDVIAALLNDILPAGHGVFAMLTLKAYIDRGAKPGKDRMMCVAASLYRPMRYKRFKKKWDEFLAGWGASAFHATDFYTGAREFWRKRPDGSVDPDRLALFERDKRRLPSLIGRYSEDHFVVAFSEDEFDRRAPAAWRARFGDLYSVSVQMLSQAIGHWADRTHFHGQIAYFLEKGDDGWGQADRALGNLQADGAMRRQLRMASHTFAEKGAVRGLEAADFLAWHWNKFYVQSILAEKPWPVRDDIAKFIKANADHVHVYLFKGDMLVRFLVENGCVVRQPLQVPPEDTSAQLGPD